MRRGSVAFVLLVLSVAVAASTAAQAAQPLVQDILTNPTRWHKERVSLLGVVSDSEVLVPQAGSAVKYRGQYTLNEPDTGASIRVRTIGNAPPNGKEVRVRAQVDVGATGVPVLLQTTSWWPPAPPVLAALVVLVVLAVVLAVLLVKGPDGGGKAVDDQRLVEEPAPSGLPCPSCSAINPYGSNFCHQCRAELAPDSSGSSGTGPVSAPVRDPQTRFYQPDEPALADLTVIEGDGARRNTQFPLRRIKQRIGRRDDMEIRLEGDDTVSREHAAVWWDDGSFYIQDLASTSGTYVNGQRVVKQSLMDSDVVQLGRTKLVFRMIGAHKEAG